MIPRAVLGTHLIPNFSFHGRASSARARGETSGGRKREGESGRIAKAEKDRRQGQCRSTLQGRDLRVKEFREGRKQGGDGEESGTEKKGWRGRGNRRHERHERRARGRDESARNKVPCRGGCARPLKRLQTRAESRLLFSLSPHDDPRRSLPNYKLALSTAPPLSNVKLLYTVVVDCFRCNYNFDLGGLSSDIIINYRVGVPRASKALAGAPAKWNERDA